MAFSMNGMSSAFGTSGSGINEQDEVPEIQTQLLGFMTLNGDKKARVLPSPWPQHALPPSYALLLSIASANGLYAAGGPDNLVIGRTDDARDGIYRKAEKDDIRNIAPIHRIPHQRLAHVVFASDESCLVVAEQESPGIVVYKTVDLVAQSTNVALKLATNAPIRSIVPNPDPAQAQYFAILTTTGQLHLADLGSGQFGPALAENVACMVWSNKGKQLMAGKGDGTAVQLKTDGTVVATVGKPGSVPGNCHLAQITWIENDVFFFVYTPSQPQDVNDIVSEYYIVKTDKNRSSWNFHKLGADPFFPSVDRTPAHFHTARLRNYEPNLEQLLIFTTTISPDIRMVTKAKEPLSSELKQQNAYTLTIPESDGRMAALPVGDSTSDTTAIGMAIDLSDKDPIVRPLPTDPEYDNSVVPLPELMTLNNEGVMCIWAVVYDDGVRSNKPYSGFADIAKIPQVEGLSSANAMDEAPSAPVESAPPPNSSTNPPSAASPFATVSSNQQTPAFGQPSAFGTGSGFSKPTPIGGEQKSSWASTGFSGGSQQQGSAFGNAPAFGNTPALGSSSKPAFGQASTPAFGQTGFGQAAKPAFGQSSFGGQANSSSPFSAAPKPQAAGGFGAGSGFGAFAGAGSGFGAANKENKTESPFGKFGGSSGFGDAKPASPFAAAGTSTSSPFSQPANQSSFGKPSAFNTAAQQSSSPFAQAGKGFKLESTFQKDETSMRDDADDDDGGSFGFGRALGGALGASKPKTETTQSKEEEMKDDAEEVARAQKSQETPPSTISQPKTTTTPHVQSLFGQSTTPQTQPKNLSTGWGFGDAPSTTPKDAPAPQKSIFGTKSTSEETPAVVAKSEPAKPFSFSSKDTTSPFATINKDKPSVFGKAQDVPSIFPANPAVPMFGTKTSSSDTPARVEKSEPKKPLAFGVTELSDSDRVKSLSDDEDEESTPEKVPEAPLPPDPSSKPDYQAGDTSASSVESRATAEPDDAPLPPDFMPANKTASVSLKTEPSDVPLSVVSSDFDEGSGEDVTGDVSPVEERDEHEEIHEQVTSSPESSFGRVSEHDSPAGSFTSVSKAPEQPKGGKLFGEMSSAPIFAPPKPKPQESPRSPSPMRKPARQTLLSPERSFSAPAQPRQSMIEQRKQEFANSPFGLQAEKARKESAENDRARSEALRKEQEAAAAAQQQTLEDDEDAILQEELAKPIQPVEHLDPFMTHQIGKNIQDPANASRTDIPAQIEKLYQDINSMIINLGINARSLSSYMLYQSSQQPNEQWPGVLESDTPMDALTDEWYLGDIPTLPAGSQKLDELSQGLEVKDVMQKLEDCHSLLTKEVADLRSRIISLRRSTSAKKQPEDTAHAPLSAEQLSIQSDLRKSSVNVLTNLSKVEDELVLLRAKLADLAPQKDDKKFYIFGSPAQKKPSVEAVMNTVSKMTSMAEKRSADVDVLEVQMKKLGIVSERPTTPQRQIRHAPMTPKSGASSVYHTPGSNRGRSARGTPAQTQAVFSVEDRDRLLVKARKKKSLADALRGVLKDRHASQA